MIEYKCSKCGIESVRLWRQYQTFLDYVELMCVDCAEKDQNRPSGFDKNGNKILGQTDQIGWLVPAVPTIEDDTFWGYSSVPQDRVKWWYSLPLK